MKVLGNTFKGAARWEELDNGSVVLVTSENGTFEGDDRFVCFAIHPNGATLSEIGTWWQSATDAILEE